MPPALFPAEKGWEIHERSQQRVPRQHPTFITRGDSQSQEPPRTDAVVRSGATP